ncbi:profilin [Mytilus galloprovincialis]|uniref:Profilin n=1 Tax=Mytilus galloprovincialis TaxID=29158 RepID=A0A8B6E1E1_MYTGA|nr:profilin [Mytilus galloprovincialis]
MTTLGFVFIFLFVALIFQHINGEICGGDYATEYECDIGTCCKVDGRWDCLTDEQDSYMCEDHTRKLAKYIVQGWNGYIDNLIGQSRDASGFEHVDRACIIGLDGGAKWTTDSYQNALKLSSNEASTIAKAFKSEDFTPFMVNGIYAEGVKYYFLREEESKIVFAKKKWNGALTLQRSKTAIVIAHTKDGGQQGNANKAVGVIAEYLESMGM